MGKLWKRNLKTVGVVTHTHTHTHTQYFYKRERNCSSYKSVKYTTWIYKNTNRERRSKS